MNIKILAGVLLLVFQLVMIGYARFVPTRYFCWGPYDSLNYYEIHTRVGGKELTSKEIRKRYHINAQGTDHRAIAHIFDIVSKYEESYGGSEGAEVRINYSTNGHEERLWRLARR